MLINKKNKRINNNVKLWLIFVSRLLSQRDINQYNEFWTWLYVWKDILQKKKYFFIETVKQHNLNNGILCFENISSNEKIFLCGKLYN